MSARTVAGTGAREDRDSRRGSVEEILTSPRKLVGLVIRLVASYQARELSLLE